MQIVTGHKRTEETNNLILDRPPTNLKNLEETYPDREERIKYPIKKATDKE